VLEAHDDALDREIALKILHRGTRAEQGSRLIREAQALARLSHPNVVQVYEVGTVDGQTFIAMERIRGRTLQEWQARRPPWRECVQVYLQAGRGLAAAHAVGLVHRDFKPSNCIVDHAGQVRVLDFGLARERMNKVLQEGAAEPRDDSRSGSSSWSSTLTQTGAVLGTLAYMPLEQLNGHPADERSDQFSLCASLYEALYGQRPFDDGSAGKLTLALLQGQIRAAPPGARVPARLRRVLLRGLATAPEARWPSVDALLAELSRLVAPRRARFIVVGLGGGLAVLGGALWQQSRTEARCEASQELLAGAWDERQRDAVEAALEATAVPYAADTWSRIEPKLDAYANAWVEHQRDACEASLVRGVQTEAVMSLRMGCLSTRRLALREVVEVLAHADAGVVEHAVALVAELPGLDRCDDVEALQAEVPPPEDPAMAARVSALREELAQIVALVAASRYDAALLEIDAIAGEVETLGHAPLQAEVRLHRGEILLGQAHYAEAEQALVQAYALAVEHGHEQVAAEAATRLVEAVGGPQARYSEGRQWGVTAMALAKRQGPAAVARTLDGLGEVSRHQGSYDDAVDHHQRALALREHSGAADDPAMAETLTHLGNALRAQGRYEEALAQYSKALEIQQRALGRDHPQLAATLSSLGTVVEEQGNYEQALGYQEQALAIWEQALGREHPAVAATLINMGIVLRHQGRLDDARAAYERALAIFTTAMGPDHPNVAATRLNLGVVLERQGRHAEAFAEFQHAHGIFVKSVGADHPNVATVLDNMGAALQGLHRYDEALDHHQRALAIKERVLGPDHPDVARSLGNVGRISTEQGKPSEALVHLQRSLAIFEKVWGPDHPEVANTLGYMALAEVARDQPAAGRAWAERAVVILDKSEASPAPRAMASFVLAQCSWGPTPAERALAVERAERALAVERAERARDGFAALGEPSREELAAVDAWLLEHRDLVDVR
jgi:eukaryotic-like serine/threonine-protein kinase